MSDPAGNVTIMAQHRNPATITDETVSAEWRNGPEFFRYTLNRYSGVLLQGANLGGGYRQFYSKSMRPLSAWAEEILSSSRVHTAPCLLIVAEFIQDGPVARLVGIEGGVVSGVFNLESSDVEASDRRPRHDDHYHEA